LTSLALSSVLKTGIEHIDEQHLSLVKMIQSFDEAISENKNDAFLEQLLNELIDYINYHFKAEEELLAQHNYPDLEKHKKTHQDLVEKVIHFHAKYKKGIPGLEVEIMFFLMDWIINHINRSDMNYAAYITGHTNDGSDTLGGVISIKKSALYNEQIPVSVEKIGLPDDCYTGIDVIDTQSLGFFDLINDLDEAIRLKDSTSKQVLASLVDHAKAQFSMEEALLQESDYPDLEVHQTMHKKFIKKISMFQRMCNDGVGCAETEIISFLKSWLIDHIRDADMGYVAYIK